MSLTRHWNERTKWSFLELSSVIEAPEDVCRELWMSFHMMFFFFSWCCCDVVVIQASSPASRPASTWSVRWVTTWSRCTSRPSSSSSYPGCPSGSTWTPPLPEWAWASPPCSPWPPRVRDPGPPCPRSATMKKKIFFKQWPFQSYLVASRICSQSAILHCCWNV